MVGYGCYPADAISEVKDVKIYLQVQKGRRRNKRSIQIISNKV